MPSRRRVLRSSVGVVLGSTAGCLGSPFSLGGIPNARELAPDGAPTAAMLPADFLPPTGPFRRFEVGDGRYDEPLRVWNDGPTREGRVRVSVDGKTVLELTDEFPGGGHLLVGFRSPADYDVRVRFGAVDHSLTLPASRFDCNESETAVAVRETEAASTFVTTDAACGWFD